MYCIFLQCDGSHRLHGEAGRLVDGGADLRRQVRGGGSTAGRDPRGGRPREVRLPARARSPGDPPGPRRRRGCACRTRGMGGDPYRPRSQQGPRLLGGRQPRRPLLAHHGGRRQDDRLCEGGVRKCAQERSGTFSNCYRSPTKFREGNVFTGVCLAFSWWGGGSHVTITHDASDLAV